jgi:two-component system OmpR family response regulator
MLQSHSHIDITLGDIKLVVIEDEEKLLSNIVEYLNLAGYNVVGFSDPLEGLEYLEKQRVDVIISDVKMPSISGFELISDIRRGKINKDAVFIFLTAKVERDDLRTGMNLQADDYITKPFVMQDLVNAINTRLKLKSDRSENSNTKPTLVKQYMFDMLDKLTKTEVKVVYLVSMGKSNDQIAERLSVSPKTVDNHRTNISAKLSISGRNKLLQVCIENKLHIKEYIQEKMRDMPHFF